MHTLKVAVLERDLTYCAMCGEAGHVSTIGPKYTQVIQYFTCKRFVDMSPAERFQVLRSKQFCLQCLLPGASSQEEKHKKKSTRRVGVNEISRASIHHIKDIQKRSMFLCVMNTRTQRRTRIY